MTKSKRTPWWDGPTVVEAFESFSVPRASNSGTVFSIQHVQRISGGGRRYLGSLHAGDIAVSSTLSSPRYPGKPLTVTSIISSGTGVEGVTSPAEISLLVDMDVDLERGDILLEGSDVTLTDQFEADLVWLDDNGGLPGRNYLLRVGHQSSKATMTRVFGIEPDGSKSGQVNHVDVNQTVRANIETHSKISVTSFSSLAELGRFVLVDPDSGSTVAVGIINHTLRRAENVVAHAFDVTSEDRQRLTGHKGAVMWFTGLSGSGKSTLVNEVSKALLVQGVPHSVLDGDALRLGLDKILGFTEADRVENIRRTAEVAKLMADSGLVVLVSLISPYRADRSRAAEIVGSDRFHEVYVSTPLEMCEQRDPKGLYKKARQGLIPNFTGVGAPYEEPLSPAYRTNPDQTVEVESGIFVASLREVIL